MADLINPSAIFGGVKSLRDFNVENTLKNQAMTEGDLKNANAANLYRTQVLTGALESGDAGIFQQALGHLASRGIDVSDISPDINTASRQVQAMRQAQYSANPLNTLLGLGIKGDQAVAAATSTMGNEAGGRALVPTAAAVADKAAALIGGMGGAQGVGVQPQPRAPLPAAQGDPLQESLDAIAKQQQTTGVSPAQRPELSLPPTAGLKKGAAMPVVDNSGAEGGFIPPAREPGDTEAAWKDKGNMALEQYKANPSTLRAQKAAEAEGTDAGGLPVKSAIAKETVSRIDKNLDSMLQSNPNVPQSRWAVDAASRAYLSQNFGDQTAAQAYSGFTKLNKAQVLNGIMEMVNSGAIRMNQKVAGIIDTVNSIDENSAPDNRAQQLEQIRAEIHNIAATAYNVNADVNGGTSIPYENIPITGKALVNPPKEMVQKLKDDPSLAPQFDEAYGSGASRMILGK